MTLRDLMPRGRDNMPVCLAWAAGVVTLLFLFQRFRYAPDFTDETFSIAMPYRYALGDKPFVDEISIQQTAGFLLFPFVWLWVKINGSTGLVLFVRVLHFLVFKGAAAAGVWFAARRVLATHSAAIATAFVPLAFVPHSIPNVGYNVIGLAFLIAGSFFVVAAIYDLSDKLALRLSFTGGILMSLMSFAYPPMAVAALTTAPLLLACAPRRRFHVTGAFIAGGVAGVLLVSPGLLFGGVSGVKRSLAWGAQAGSMHGRERLKAMLDAFWLGMPREFVYVGIGLVAAGLSRLKPLAPIAVLASILTVLWWYRDDPSYSPATSRTVIYLGALAPAFVFVAQPDRQLVRASALVIVPAFAAAAAAAVFSTQNLDAAALGLISAVVFIVLLGGRAMERAGTGATFALVPAFIALFFYVDRAWISVYRDAPLAALTETVPQGPFKGLRTTKDRVEMLGELRDIVRRFDQPDGHILVLYEQPGFYLASKMPPSAHSVWEASYGDIDGMIDFFQTKANGKGIVLKVRGMPTTRADIVLTPLDRKIYETRHFLVYRDQ
ncbi:MAG: hypothetical protein U0270_04785 [Labilithrix sp.]